ncbi:MAG: hypothetical protein EOS73_26275 [Mesorhizobium sp.]|uniref:hypothetical protein n=1 Tax=Mesorhizobium sp. M7A.F.Ca.ET.027.02.1.1 TaxID=2496655 RepID=UPI000FD29B1F|nr:hypothetical protein [Mesorhizobium sp. M7A.F.Ca.ET.027.02.1.1]RVD13018.1 hypothetical protein EN749_25130 [Mesorhizobium sp. M7A.F.Ca.ET.027.02.1.1]RWC99953.1 MAG: hypothetical protein EOS73_26275 [Mesorhizobium sp.]
MATLIVTLSHAFPNIIGQIYADVAVGAGARSEAITMPGAGTMVAAAGETIVVLLADADCWVAVGPDPDTSADGGGVRSAWPVPAGAPYPLLVAPGDTIAVETR